MDAFIHHAIWWSGHIVAALLCVTAILLSLLSFTGCWLIAAASGVLYWCRDDDAVSLPVIAVFVALCVVIELFDFLAGKIGIARRGGSAAAGWAALAGGLIGMVAGTFIPVPVVGSLLGMCAGSFIFAFWVERRRLQHDALAAHIAWGAVWARLGVVLVKTLAALGMTAALVYLAASRIIQ